MNKYLSAVRGICLNVFLCAFFVINVYGKTINSPRVSADEAIGLAKQYVEKEKLDVSQYFIASVEYINLYNEYEQPFWRIEYWLLAGQQVKGGQIIVNVYQDGTIKQTYGE